MLKETVLLEGRCLRRLRPTGRNVLRTTVVATQPPAQRRTAKNPVRGRAELRLEGTLWMVFMLVLAFVLVFGGLGCFPYTMSVMQRWISYSAKTLRDFLSFLRSTRLRKHPAIPALRTAHCCPK
jgi:hypothetical protein